MATEFDDLPPIAQNLVEIRNKLHLRQEQAAERIGTRQSTYSNWETGRVKPNAESIAKIARGLRVSADDLLKGLAEAAEASGRASPQEHQAASGKRARSG